MPQVTLESIKEAAEAKYGSTDIPFGEDGDVLVLVNPLRLDKAVRKRLSKLQDEAEEDEGEQDELFANVIVMVAKDKPCAKRFLKAVNNDLAILAEVISTYQGSSQVGEASA